MDILALNTFKKYTKALSERSNNEMIGCIDHAIREVSSANQQPLGIWPTSSCRNHTTLVAEEYQKFISITGFQILIRLYEKLGCF